MHPAIVDCCVLWELGVGKRNTKHLSIGQTKDMISSGKSHYLVLNIQLCRTCHAWQLVTIWAGSDLYKRCGMVMSQLQESFWRQKERQKEKQRNDDAVYKAHFKRKRKRNEKIHVARFETVRQERQDKKSGKTYGAGVRRTRGHNYNPEVKCAMQALRPEWSSAKKQYTLPFPWRQSAS